MVLGEDAVGLCDEFRRPWDDPGAPVPMYCLIGGDPTRPER